MKCFVLQVVAIIGLTLPSLETLELHESGKSREPIYPGQCTHPFVPIEGERCYFLSYGVIEHSWNDAKTICQWLHPEGTLAEFHSMDELVDVTLFLGRDDAACTAWGEPGPWIGGRELGDSSEFVWDSTNSSIESANWMDSMPSSPSSGDGIVLNCLENFQWQDMPNENILPFICESPPNPRPVTLGCPPGFFLLGSSCYTLGDDQELSWDDAQTYCGSLVEGGKLAELETADEVYLVDQYLEGHGTGHYWLGALGAEELGSPHVFRWSSTQDFVIFTNWFFDAPYSYYPSALETHPWSGHYAWGNYPKTSPWHPLCETSQIEI